VKANGSFQPQIVAKGQKDVTGIEGKVISMYGKGMSTRDMQDIIQDIYGVDLSPETILPSANRINREGANTEVSASLSKTPTPNKDVRRDEGSPESMGSGCRIPKGVPLHPLALEVQGSGFVN
jgi:hypothetical protein